MRSLSRRAVISRRAPAGTYHDYFRIEHRLTCRCYSPTKAGDFEGAGGPEDKTQIYSEDKPGNNDAFTNVRQ